MSSQDKFAGDLYPGLHNVMIVMENMERSKGAYRSLLLKDISSETSNYYLERIKASNTELDERYKDFDSMSKSDSVLQAWNDFKAKWSLYDGMVQKGIAQLSDYYTSKNESTYIDAKKVLVDDSEQLSKDAMKAIDTVADMLDNEAKFEDKLSDSSANRTEVFLIILIIGGLLFALGLSFVIIRNISGILQGLLTQTRTLTDAAVNGQLSTRANPDEVNFEFREVIIGMNNTLEAVVEPLNMASNYLQRIAEGDIPMNIFTEYKGDYNEIKNSINKCIDSIQTLTSEMSMVTQFQAEGDTDVFADENKFKGTYRDLIVSYNSVLQLQVINLLAVSEIVQNYSLGNMEIEMPLLADILHHYHLMHQMLLLR